MGFLDALTGKAASRSMSRLTAAQNGWLENGQDTVNSAYDAGIGELNRGALGAINVAKSYGAEAQDYLGRGLGMARGDIRGNADQALRYLGGAMDLYQPYKQQGGAASAMLSNALGLHGQDGNAAARSAFQAGPGYQWQVDQATDAAARRAGSLGMAASGNTLAALAKLGGNLANQEWGGWLDRLSGQQSVGMQASNAMAGLAGQQAGIAQQAGSSLAGLGSQWGRDASATQSNLGSQIGGWTNQLGQGQNASWMQRGNTIGGMTMQHAAGLANNYAGAAQAVGAGAQNMFGAGMGLLNSGLKWATGGNLFGGGSTGTGGLY